MNIKRERDKREEFNGINREKGQTRDNEIRERGRDTRETDSRQ